MTPGLEEVAAALFDGRVPAAWGARAYFSVKPLAAWTRDLAQRVAFFQDWARGNEPAQFWIGAFTFPTGFLTAVLQRAARRGNVPIDALSWEFTVVSSGGGDDDGPAVAAAPKEGVYVRNVFLEGAG
ncbi:hypothetical protein HK405_001737 [Cladochytrium tenue]|nr:hypothetical protein HK405_001737 [Cladochytrium tenue]